MRWVATVFPGDLQSSAFRSGGSALLAFHNIPHALWWNPVYLEPLLRPDVPMERNARRLLAVALAAVQPAEGGLATDVLIQLVERRARERRRARRDVRDAARGRGRGGLSA